MQLKENAAQQVGGFSLSGRFFVTRVDTWYIMYWAMYWNVNRKGPINRPCESKPQSARFRLPRVTIYARTALSSIFSTFRSLAELVVAFPASYSTTHLPANDSLCRLFARRKYSSAPPSIFYGQCWIGSGLLPRRRGGSPTTNNPALSASAAWCRPPPHQNEYKRKNDWIYSVPGIRFQLGGSEGENSVKGLDA